MPGSTANGEVTGAVSATSPVHPSSERAPEDLRLALRAATMYYLDGLTHSGPPRRPRQVQGPGPHRGGGAAGPA